MKIIINITNLKLADKKHVINSIKGVVKALAKRRCFEMEFMTEE